MKLARSTTLSIALFFVAVIIPSFTQAQANWITLSTYNASPEQTFNVHGYGFRPGEMVRFTFRDSEATVAAKANGQVMSPYFAVPHIAPGHYMVSAVGLTSGRSQTATLYVSGYYPVAEPSAFYVVPGQKLGFDGMRFAPREAIDIRLNGKIISTRTADAHGSFSAPKLVTIPSSAIGKVQHYRFTGRKSGASFDVNVTVGRP